jgi:transaldolase
MKLFLDSANLGEIEEALSWGVISGITTNPTLISRENVPFEELVSQICRLLGNAPVSVEVISTNAGDMIEEASRLAALAPNIVIKVPMGTEGLKAVYNLSNRETSVPCNVTLVFSVSQALLAARAGAAYVSPFIGRLDDIGGDGVALVEEMLEVFNKQGLKSQVIAASIRHLLHVQRVAAAGAHIATVPFAVLKQMPQHPLTEIGIKRFLEDWDRVKNNY